jgi:uncharacterized SAM-binding protein YcdF (DUF218 family)
MFFTLSKTLYFIALPTTWLFLCLVYLIFSKHEQRKKRLRWWFIGGLLFFTNSFITNELFLWWEQPPTYFAAIKPNQYDVAIVLTGVTSDYKSPKDRIYFHRGADRVLHTVRLFKEGKIKKILISGAEFSRGGELSNTDRSLKQVFLLCGVPDSVIFTEMQSRNTYENAIFSAKIIEKQFPKGKCLLVTSAFHVRRARACFEKAGIGVDAFSTDFYAGDRSSLSDLDMVALVEILTPTVDALGRWNIFIKEILGYITYKVLGYA